MREQWLSTRHVCSKYDVTRDSLLRWEKDGHIQSGETPGGYKRFLESDVREMLNLPEVPIRKRDSLNLEPLLGADNGVPK